MLDKTSNPANSSQNNKLNPAAGTREIQGSFNVNAAKQEHIQELMRRAEKGSPAAINDLGMYYLEVKDYRNAKNCFEEAIKKNYSAAYHNLAHLYFCGLGVPKNVAKSLELTCKIYEE